MTKEQKMYYKIGQAVANGLIMLGFCSAWIGIFIYALIK